jgi:hypothetical protein
VLAAGWLLVAAVLAFGAGPARAEQLPVVVVPGLELSDLQPLQSRGAVGLLVPAAGPRTSAAAARAALVRGRVRNSLRGGFPDGPVLIRVETSPKVSNKVLQGLGRGIVLGLPAGGDQRNDRRYPIAVLAPGYRGLLTSEQTRIPGIVSIADVAPTALGRADALGSEPAAEPVADLRALDRRIDENRTARRLPANLALSAGVVLVALLVPSAAVLALATGAAVNLALGIAGVSEPWLTIPALLLGVVALGPLAALGLRDRLALGLALAGVIAAYLVSMAIDPTWVALSPLGPTQNSRFYGFSNLLETMLLPVALTAAVLLARRLGAGGFGAVALLALATVSGSRFGADGGGALVLAAGFAVLAVGLIANPRTARLAALAVGGGAVALAVADALIGPATHVGRSLRGGPDELASDLTGRVTLSWERATTGWLVGLAVALSLVALAVVVSRLPRLRISRDGRTLLLAFAAAVAVSLIVNDSPREVAVGGLVGYVALEAFVRARKEGAPRYNSAQVPRGAETT